MYNNPFYIPGYNQAIMAPNLMRGFPATRTLANTARAANSSGLFSRLGSSLTGIKSINWGGLINNTSKTLGIINQTIPIVRQVGPMINNMKQMMRLASIFKDETDTRKSSNNITNNLNNSNTKSSNNTLNVDLPRNTKTNQSVYTSNSQTNPNRTNTYTNEKYDESPTFFIST